MALLLFPCNSVGVWLAHQLAFGRLPLLACSPPFPTPSPNFVCLLKKKFVVPGKNASLTLLDCLCSKTFCKILDKAAEDLSNLRKSTKASGSDAIELSDEYIECLLSSFSESQKLNTKYLIEHGYSSMKLPYYNSVNSNCRYIIIIIIHAYQPCF